MITEYMHLDGFSIVNAAHFNAVRIRFKQLNNIGPVSLFYIEKDLNDDHRISK
jgi:hypothetical protein